MVNIKKIVDDFNKNYETLYNLNTDIYKSFVQYRQDVLSSDREFAAYGLTLYDLNLV